MRPVAGAVRPVADERLLRHTHCAAGQTATVLREHRGDGHLATLRPRACCVLRTSPR
ncbi:hypothetical protein [Nonomuraea sp. NEAU-A123]|uniref:helix-turn-helix domain-containing protein n=1 Tax=Nonomuraea sp. NEAU-A123 TaxID=2839649 RepID=UPI0035AC1303